MNVGGTPPSLANTQSQGAIQPSTEQLATSRATPSSASQPPADPLVVSRSNDPLQPTATQSTNANVTVQRADTQAQVNRNAAVDLQSSTTLPATPASRSNEAASAEQANAQAQIRQLAKIDREVRDHEAAHAAAGGGLAGAPSYSYTKGPDGQLYATSGEVDIDTSASAEPSETVANARTVIEAALAPANPSTQDLRVAAQARAQLIDAQAQLTRNEQQAIDQQRQADSRLSGSAAEVQSQEVQSQELRQQSQVSQTLEVEAEQALAEDDEDKDKDQAYDDKRPDDSSSSFQENRSLLAEREARIHQSQLDFAQELSDLNQRIQRVQQQLIETGEVNPASLLQGSLLDTLA